MSTRVNARFQEQAEAELVAPALKNADFKAWQIATFYVRSPGQHDLDPIGGDEMKSLRMKDVTVTGTLAAAHQ